MLLFCRGQQLPKHFVVGRKSTWRRNMSNASYPAHVVVNMPALSPTMEAGTIGKWLCKVGDEIKAGSAMAEIETDKASMTFEAQDEFFIAKLLSDVGQEVKVGQPILVTVEDKSLVSAFSSFTLNSASASSAKLQPPPSTSTPDVNTGSKKEEVVTVTPPVISVPTRPAPSSPSPPPAAPTTTIPSAASVSPEGIRKTSSPAGTKASGPSPLLAKFRKDQLLYIEKYGRSCHKVIQK